MLNRAYWRTRRYIHHHTIELSIAVLIFIFLMIFFAGNMFYTIPAGSVGVLWERFGGGTVLDRTLGEGFHTIMPWNRIYIYDIRVQLRDQELDVLSVDGLNLRVDVAYRFELIPQTVPLLHQFVGPDYVNVMIAPDIAANARDVFSVNTPQEIFSERRKQIQNDILLAVNNHLRNSFNPDPGKPIMFVKVEDVLTRSIKLPPAVEAAINSKNEQQQLNQEYDYRILREAKESQRKRVEAQGIREFQDTISRGITDSYLRWRGIEATLELARSPNSKIVIIGGGKSGLPLILGNMDNGPSVANTGTIAAAPPALEATPAPPLPPLASLEKSLGIAPAPTPAAAPAPTPFVQVTAPGSGRTAAGAPGLAPGPSGGQQPASGVSRPAK